MSIGAVLNSVERARHRESRTLEYARIVYDTETRQ
jgi:hypothetical protein